MGPWRILKPRNLAWIVVAARVSKMYVQTSSGNAGSSSSIASCGSERDGTLSKTYKCNDEKRDLHERDPDERGQHERSQHERGEREQQGQREDESLQHSRTKSKPQRGEDEAVDENDDADDAGRDHGDEDDQQPHVRARENEHTAHEHEKAAPAVALDGTSSADTRQLHCSLVRAGRT